MGIRVQIHKSDWARASFALKHSSPVIRKEMNAGIRQATKPIVAELKSAILSWESSATSTGGGAAGRARVHVERSRSGSREKAKAAAARKMARGGFGLRKTIAASIQTKITTSGFRSGVRIRVDSARLGHAAAKLPKLIDEGKWRHPVYGDREAWVTQTGKKGWFSDTAERGARAAGREIKGHIDRAMARINDGQA